MLKLFISEQFHGGLVIDFQQEEHLRPGLRLFAPAHIGRDCGRVEIVL